MFKKVLGILLATAVLATSAYALEVGGVKLPDTLSAGGEELGIEWRRNQDEILY